MRTFAAAARQRRRVRDANRWRARADRNSRPRPARPRPFEAASRPRTAVRCQARSLGCSAGRLRFHCAAHGPILMDASRSPKCRPGRSSSRPRKPDTSRRCHPTPFCPRSPGSLPGDRSTFMTSRRSIAWRSNCGGWAASAASCTTIVAIRCMARACSCRRFATNVAIGGSSQPVRRSCLTIGARIESSTLRPDSMSSRRPWAAPPPRIFRGTRARTSPARSIRDRPSSRLSQRRRISSDRFLP